MPSIATEQLRAIVYVSSASEGLGYAGVLEILERSRVKNARLDITGVLLFFRRRFMQYLEGPRPALDGLFEQIRADPRHHSLTLLLNQPLRRREFNDWRLAFGTPDQPGFDPTLILRDVYTGSSQPRWLLKNFLEVNAPPPPLKVCHSALYDSPSTGASGYGEGNGREDRATCFVSSPPGLRQRQR